MVHWGSQIAQYSLLSLLTVRGENAPSSILRRLPGKLSLCIICTEFWAQNMEWLGWKGPPPGLQVWGRATGELRRGKGPGGGWLHVSQQRAQVAQQRPALCQQQCSHHPIPHHSFRSLCCNTSVCPSGSKVITAIPNRLCSVPYISALNNKYLALSIASRASHRNH